ncbi:MAG TPA: hypothetical protein VGJ53_02985 [Micromonosporaceae bacterium]
MSADAAAQQPGWLRRIFRGEDVPPEPDVLPPPPPPPGELHERRRGPQPIAAPAMGDAFSFQVYADYSWRSTGLYPDELRVSIERHTAEVHNGLRELITNAAREFPPHHVSKLQARLDEALTSRVWRFDRDVRALSCRAQVRVAPDDRVRQRLQPYWEKVIEMECEHQLGMRRAELVEELTKRWSTVLEDLRDKPLTPHAARLTEEQFASVFERLISERHDALQEVIRILQDASRDHREGGLQQTEIVQTYDSLLRAVRNLYDLGDASRSGPPSPPRQRDARNADPPAPTEPAD